MNKDTTYFDPRQRDSLPEAGADADISASAQDTPRADGTPPARGDSSSPDIFDRIMSARLLRPLKPLYNRYKEILLYVFFGALTTLVSLATFYFFANVLNVHELISNAVSWIFAVTFAYVTNRTWVFEDKAHTRSGVIREASAFYGGRLATLGFEELVILVFVTILGFNDMLIKVLASVGVLVLNYVISKLIVFKKEK